MTLNLTVPKTLHTDFTPRIAVIGVGGGGTNAVDNMIQLNLQGVEFIVANTDAQQLMHSRSDRRIQLGPHLTQGLGAGANPEIGRLAAEEAAEELARHLDGAHMVFITAGMGGGTGTGAAPIIARMARERGILTVGVVTKPFTFEGVRRSKAANVGIAELQQFVDTLIVIQNQNLFRLANEKTGWKEAFRMADHVLYMGVRGVTDLMVAPGLVNLDFADIRAVMAEMGRAMMGTGEAEGENRAIRAAEAAISNPLLEDTSMAGARGLLINITGGEDMTLFEVDQAANRIREEVAEYANIIFGSAVDDNLAGRIRVSVVATGIDTPIQMNPEPAAPGPRLVAVASGAQATTLPPRVERAQPELDSVALPTIRRSVARFPLHTSGAAALLALNETSPENLVPVLTQTSSQQAQPTAEQRYPPLSKLPSPHIEPEPTQARRSSLFGMVTGAWRRAPEAGSNFRRPETRFGQKKLQPEDSGNEPSWLEIPAFLRRQSNTAVAIAAGAAVSSEELERLLNEGAWDLPLIIQSERIRDIYCGQTFRVEEAHRSAGVDSDVVEKVQRIFPNFTFEPMLENDTNIEPLEVSVDAVMDVFFGKRIR